MKVPLVDRGFWGFIIGTPSLRWLFIGLILLVLALHIDSLIRLMGI